MDFIRKIARCLAPQQAPAKASALPSSDADDAAKLQRMLRRQSLLGEQQAEQLVAIRARLDSIDQSLLAIRLADEGPSDEHTVEEAELLAVLDSLDRVRASEGVSLSMHEILDEAAERLRRIAGLRPLALAGSPPDTIGCRIVEVVPDPEAAGFTITRIIRQGYARADGSRIREAVVIVTGASELNLQ